MESIDTDNGVEWETALRFWWAFTWRSSIFLIGPLILLAVLSFFLPAIVRGEYLKAIRLFVGLASIPIQISILRSLLIKRFGNFRLTVIREDPDA
jgi:hypothetical protein